MSMSTGQLIHVDLIGDMVWVQYDSTEEGVAGDMLGSGIPKEAIVLGFRPPEVRKYTGFATG